MYQRQFNYRETKQVILADIFNTLKDKGYGTDDPIRIPDEMEYEKISVHAYDKILDLDYFLSMTITEIQTSIGTLAVIGSCNDSDEECFFDDEILGIDTLSLILDYVEGMPEAKDATYNNEEE